jgi:HPt (histidine-containing phosphotransfer) domain-containing protein
MKYLTPVSWQPINWVRQEQAEYDLWQKLVIDFVKNNRNKFKEISGAIKEGNIKLAHRLTHTLKSNASQLGKSILQNAAAIIENQLKDGENRVTVQQLSSLETELAAVLAEFSPLFYEFSNKESEPGNEPLDLESASILIEQLESLLKAGSTECLNFIDNLRRIPGSETLIQQIEDFEFKPAQVTAAELKKNLI